ncbi:MAG: aminoglycoside phosphotransferase family protein [Chloroflexi bacterium]|nr:aminoglycoside phosphotransferase family protein [Chloroflexota bacterium]
MPGRAIAPAICNETMAVQDFALPFLEMAWSLPDMQEFLNRQVMRALCPGKTVRGLAINRMTYSPGGKCAIMYDARFGESPESPRQPLLVSFDKGDRLQKAYELRYGDSGVGTGGRAVYLPEYRCLVELFPDDWNLPSLAMTMDPKQAAEFLARVGVEGAEAPLIEVLSYRIHRRCVLRYGGETPDGAAGVVGKVYAPGVQIEEIARKLEALRAQAKGKGVIVQTPLGVAQELNMLMLGWVPGAAMSIMLEKARSRSEAEETARLAAQVLATLHTFRLDGTEVRVVESELAHVRQRSRRLPVVVPRLGRQAGAILNQIEPLVGALSPVAPALLHGDYKPGQLVVNGGQVAVIDVDRVCVGDPAVDVGNFMAALQEMTLRTGSGQLQGMEEHFLTEYMAHTGDQGLELRARVAQCIALVRLALSRFRAAPYAYTEDCCSLPDLLLEEAAACLTEL